MPISDAPREYQGRTVSPIATLPQPEAQSRPFSLWKTRKQPGKPTYESPQTQTSVLWTRDALACVFRDLCRWIGDTPFVGQESKCCPRQVFVAPSCQLYSMG